MLIGTYHRCHILSLTLVCCRSQDVYENSLAIYSVEAQQVRHFVCLVLYVKESKKFAHVKSFLL